MGLSMDSIIDKVIIFLVIVAVVPSALVSYFNVTTTTWDAATVAIWGILSLIFIVGLFKGLRGGGGR